MAIQIKDLTAVQEIDMSAVRGGLIIHGDTSCYTGGSDYNTPPAAPVTMATLWNQMFGSIAPV